jgi:hypothetical protein
MMSRPVGIVRKLNPLPMTLYVIVKTRPAPPTPTPELAAADE